MPKNYFDPKAGPAIVLRPFRFAGEEFAKGQVFPWRKLGRSPDGKVTPLPEAELTGLWMADMISFEPQRAKGRENSPTE